MGMILSPYAFSASVPAVPATFAPEYKGPNITASNSNRTATKTTSNAYSSIGCIEAKVSGQWYFEVTVDTLVTGNLAIGVGHYLALLDAQLGNDTSAIMYTSDNTIRTNNATVGTAPGAYGTSDVICVALDVTNRRFHVRKNNGPWANSGDPPANTGGHFLGGAQPLFPLVQLYYNGTAVTLNCGQSAFAYSPPSGFSAWAKNASNARRYSRLHQHTSNTVNFVVAELELRETSGGADQTSPSGTAIASSVWDGTGTYAAIKAFDNNASTIYHSQNTLGLNAWLQYDFGVGVTKDVRELVFTIRSDTLGYSSQFKLLSSDDGTNMYPVMGFAAQTWPSAGSTRTFTRTD